MRISLAQINSCLGDFEKNRQIILEYTEKAVEKRCDIVVFPEAALFGYHPVDLLERSSIVQAQLKELDKLEKQIPTGIAVVLGAITLNKNKTGKRYHNSAVFLQKDKKRRVFAKELLPTYDVFDEGRHIEPGDITKNTFSFKGKKILVTICEDIWAWPNAHHGSMSPYKNNPLKKLKSKDVDLILNLSASPFTGNKIKSREQVCKQCVEYFKAPMVYVNMVGAQDEIIFDGASFALDKSGKKIAKSIQFQEDLNIVDFKLNQGGLRERVTNKNECLRRALVLGLQDFVEKTGFEKVHLGLSGGIDSALVACLAVDALGPMNVSCIALPSLFNTKESYSLARELCHNLAVEFYELPIADVYNSVDSAFKSTFGDFAFDLTNENMQARIRGLLLMAFSNKYSSLLLNTSNKSEFATGYSTLYGDMVGGLSPIGDLLKTQVYELSRHYNKEAEVIPQMIIDRAPSAELRPNQKDEDTLLPYDELDPIIYNLVEKFKKPTNSKEQKVLTQLMKSEFKRWQAPPILKVSNHAFGRGRRLPVAHRAIF